MFLCKLKKKKKKNSLNKLTNYYNNNKYISKFKQYDKYIGFLKLLNLDNSKRKTKAFFKSKISNYKVSLLYGESLCNRILNNFLFNKNNTYTLISYANIIYNKIWNLFDNKCLYYSTSGNFITLISIDKDNNVVKFLLPSNNVLITSRFCFVKIGRANNIFNKYIFYGLYKYGNKNKKIRGIAQNPIDHPNGGRSNTKKPFLNKFGKIAKYNKIMLNYINNIKYENFLKYFNFNKKIFTIFFKKYISKNKFNMYYISIKINELNPNKNLKNFLKKIRYITFSTVFKNKDTTYRIFTNYRNRKSNNWLFIN